MISQRTLGLQRALLVCQSLLVVVALWISMVISFTMFTGASREHLERYPIYGAVLILGLVADAFSRRGQVLSTPLMQQGIIDHHSTSLRQTIYASGALFLYLAATKDAFISRTVLAVNLPLLYVTLLGANCILPRALAKRIFCRKRRERALLIGPAAQARRLQPWLESKEVLGFETVGLISGEPEHGFTDLPWLGTTADLVRVLSEQEITQVIFLELPDDSAAHEELVGILENHGARVLIFSNLEERLRHRAVHFTDGGLDFITLRFEPLEDPINRLLKRSLDLVVALPIVVFILPPVAVFVWVLQRMQSPGPLFYRQLRAGIQNRRFMIVKFRTMHAAETSTLQATSGDPRIFPAGRWLRRLSLDEIPQFWNVLTGEMSVCGPRPHLLEHNEEFARKMARYHMRAVVKPGITGLAQVRGFRGEVREVGDLAHRLESDIEYLENWRLALDLMVIFRTALQVVLFAGNGLIGIRSRPRQPSAASVPPDGSLVQEGQAVRSYARDAHRRPFRQILGIRFFTGSADDAVAIGMEGGLVVAPSAPVLLGLEKDTAHRAAVRGSALAITDSGLMVMLWELLTGEKATRVSGLAYLKLLLRRQELRAPGAVFWVMPAVSTMRRNIEWLSKQGFTVTEDDCYIAPQYDRASGEVSDPALAEILGARRPAHIIMAVGGGVQEKLGASLLKQLAYRPAIHCTGAAIGFLSGEQVRIPMWADRLRLGWLFRCIDEPAKFMPRYWESRKLVSLMLRYHGRLPGADAAWAAPVDQRPLSTTTLQPARMSAQ